MATQTYTDGVSLSSATEFNLFDSVAYAVLSSVAGTNTITATGPANYTLAATRPPVWFIPAVTNTGATTIAITPSGGSALAAKNIFANGAACVGGELIAGIPVGIVYDGTQFNILQNWPRFKVGSFTRDVSVANGNQAVTGVGFTPKAIIFLSGLGGTSSAMSVGFTTISAHGVVFDKHVDSDGAYGLSASYSIYMATAASAQAGAAIASMDADGFTVTWTKVVGSPTGTATVYYLALR